MNLSNGTGGNEQVKKSLHRRALDSIKNKPVVVAGAAVMGIFIGLAFVKSSCCDGEFSAREPALETVRGDGNCNEVLESHPFLRDFKTGRELQDATGQRIPNPRYSWEDCFKNNWIYDGAAEPSGLRDGAGRPVNSPFIKQERAQDGQLVYYLQYLDSRRFNLPLENENSFDFRIKRALEMRCAERTDTNVIDRPALKRSGEQVLRTQAMIEDMHAHPDRVRPGDNFFLIVDNYDESCGTETSVPLCEPENPERLLITCRCPNLRECAPREDPCKNGRRDQGEACDSTATPTGCTTKQRCASDCSRCVDITDPCGNGRIDRPRERCDPEASPTGCGEGETCADNCRTCRPRQPPPITHMACVESRCERVPGAGTDECSSDNPCPQTPPPPPPTDGCRAEVKRTVCAEALATLGANAPAVRSKAGVAASTDVGASVSVTIVGGIPRPATAVLTPSGSFPLRFSSRFGTDTSCNTSCDGLIVNGERQ